MASPSIDINMSLKGKAPEEQKPSDSKETSQEEDPDEKLVVVVDDKDQTMLIEGGSSQDAYSPTGGNQPKEEIMREVLGWIQDMESIRDDLTLMSVKNAILLDSLTMAGADV